MVERIINGIRLPEKVLKAQQEGNLVIFAGAGISMGNPSNLPNFNDLTKQVYEHIYGTKEIDTNLPVETILGNLERDSKPVKEIICNILNIFESKPNTLHQDIPKLFTSKDDIKIVTTNFDNHLTTTTTEISNSTIIYKSPALPLGNDFNGIVYLHGHVSEPKKIVATDSDFGRAYITEGWARRFLVDLFRKESPYITLFIGYSHEDTIMKYLSRGLPPSVNNRYSLVLNDDKSSDWKAYGIETILFEKDEIDIYRKLYVFVNNWSREAQSKLNEVIYRIKDIVKTKYPSNVNLNTYSEEISFLLHKITEIKYFRVFISELSRIEDIQYLKIWLDWLDNNDLLNRYLFSIQDMDENVTEISRRLAEWFVKNFVIENANIGLIFIAIKKKQINSNLWYAISTELCRNIEKPIPINLAKWISVLIDNDIKDYSYDTLGYLFDKLELPLYKTAILNLIQFLTEPVMIFSPHYYILGGNDEKVTLNIKIRAEDYSIYQTWNEKIKPNMSHIDEELYKIFISQLTKAYLIVLSNYETDISYDPLSFRRSAIEPHQQDQFREAHTIFIDIIRDLLEYYCDNDSDYAEQEIKKHLNSKFNLFQRIAIHALNYHNNITPDDKIKLILEYDLLYDLISKHEIYKLLKDNFEKLSDEVKEKLIAMIEIGPNEIQLNNLDEDHKDRVIYDLCGYIISFQDNQKLKEILEIYQAKYPIWKQSDHPEFNSYFKSGTIVPKSPLNNDEFESKSISELLLYLNDFQEVDRLERLFS